MKTLIIIIFTRKSVLLVCRTLVGTFCRRNTRRRRRRRRRPPPRATVEEVAPAETLFSLAGVLTVIPRLLHYGEMSLCNACGIRFKKEERRATAAAASSNGGAAAHGGHVDTQQYMMNGSSWGQPQKTTPCYSSAYGNEFRFIEDDVVDHRDSQFLSWRFNVADRPSLVHDFTR
ncbi:hypothetical protein DH2020_037824 [Rehmannia glutinosa]|uniref:GATA transcription factor n=1 Tax=Rehmannia glutinosa TaxID=99300 RepID=A0ABR0V216_REHGL